VVENAMMAQLCHPERSEGSLNVSGPQRTEMVIDVSLLLNMTMLKGAAVIATALLWVGAVHAQSMFRGDPAHSGKSASQAPRQFHRVKWKFPTGERIIASPAWESKVVDFGGDEGNIYA